MATIHLIAAVDKGMAIGRDNKLLYYLPSDLKHFKALTTGHTIIMGRRTYESLPNGALPQRRNLILSRSLQQFEGAETYGSLGDALEVCNDEEEVFIIGGAEVYKQAFPLADYLHLTHIDAETADADAFFPEINADDWTAVSEEWHEKDEKHAHRFCFKTYKRRTKK